MVALRRFAFSLLPYLASHAAAASTHERRDDAPALTCAEKLVLPSKEVYDLSKLAGAHTLTRTRDTPPTKMEDTIRFDLCADLADDAKSEDQVRRPSSCRHYTDADLLCAQCPSGTRACLAKTNKKASDSDRVIAVVPLAQSSALAPTYTVLTCLYPSSPPFQRCASNRPPFP